MAMAPQMIKTSRIMPAHDRAGSNEASGAGVIFWSLVSVNCIRKRLENNLPY
jgi:hypothetical protein